MKLHLTGYKVTNFSVVNDMRPGDMQQPEINYSYNVSYSRMGLCRSEMKVHLEGKEDPSKLSMSMTICGNFEILEPDADRDIVHVESFKMLFPIARATVAAMTAAAGMPPMNLPYVNIESQNIYRMNFKTPDGKNSMEDK